MRVNGVIELLRGNCFFNAEEKSEAHATSHYLASLLTQRTSSSSVRLRKDLSWMKRTKAVTKLNRKMV